MLPPSLEDEVARLVAIYGKDAVKAAVKATTKPPRGRQPLPHKWKRLSEWLKEDAQDWLEGRDPFAMRTNRSIALQYSEKYPGDNVASGSTMRLIQGLLAKKRQWLLLLRALHSTKDEYPYTVHLKVLNELATIDPEWTGIRDTHQRILAQYREVHGDPEPSMAWSAIEAAPRYHPMKALAGLMDTFPTTEDP